LALAAALAFALGTLPMAAQTSLPASTNAVKNSLFSSSQPFFAGATTPTSDGMETAAAPAQDTAPAAKKDVLPSDIYNGGFFVESKDKSFSLYANGLFQVRYTGFIPKSTVAPFGEPTTGTSTFDVYLARVALSGSVFQPSLK